MLVPDGLMVTKAGRRVPAWAAPMLEFPEATVTDLVRHLKAMRSAKWEWMGWRLPASRRPARPRRARRPLQRKAPQPVAVVVDLNKAKAFLSKLGPRVL